MSQTLSIVSVRKGSVLLRILILQVRVTSASNFRSHVACLIWGRLAGYGASVLDGACHRTLILPVGLHAMAISGQVVVVGSPDIKVKSPCMRLGAAAGIAAGISTARCCAGGSLVVVVGNTGFGYGCGGFA